mgnify:FL=1
MASGYNQWERFNNRLNLWFNGIVAFSIIPFGIIFLDTQSEFPSAPIITGSFAIWIQIILNVLIAAVVLLGIRYPKKPLSSIRKVDSIPSRLTVYLHCKVRSFLLIEAAAILACVGFYLTKQHLFTGAYLAIMFVFSLVRPTFEKVANDINVSQQALTEWGGQVAK